MSQTFHLIWKVIHKFIIVVNKFWDISATEVIPTNSWGKKMRNTEEESNTESSYIHTLANEIFTYES